MLQRVRTTHQRIAVVGARNYLGRHTPTVDVSLDGPYLSEFSDW